MTPGGRLFAAVVPPPEVVAALAERLEPVSIPGRPVPPANWHVTLRFVGEVDAVAYERWLAALDNTAYPKPFRLTLGGFGAFPRPGKATVLWVGVDGEDLASLAELVDEAAAAAGLGHEERPFRPHLTIARVRPPADVSALVDSEDDWKARFRIDRFHLLAAVGRRYHRFETFEL